MYGFSLYFTEVVENLKLDYRFWDGGNTKVQRFKNLEHEDIILFFFYFLFLFEVISITQFAHVFSRLLRIYIYFLNRRIIYLREG